MPTRDEWRKALAPQQLTDKELDEFLAALHTLLEQVLDEYFREEFEPDDG